tara:strand:+ start:6208 stop:7083 length:876 start_codon:yes stop_codon:yes gene_type:complete
MITAKVRVDTTGAKKKTKSIERGITREFGIVSKLASKRAAFFCQQYTLPAATKSNDWPFQKMSERIKEDVEAAYGSKSDYHWEWKAYKVIEEYKGKEKANEWWQLFRTGDQSSLDVDNPGKRDHETKFDRMRFPSGVRTANEKKYIEYRKKNNYKIPRGRSAKVLGVTQEQSRNSLITKRQKTKGLAKAGWKACFHSAGGRGLDAGKMGGTSRKWPSQLKVPYSKFGKMALGSTSIKHTQKGFRSVLRNEVDYMDEAFPDHMRDIAAKWTNRYMKIIFEQRKKHVGKKTQK